MPILRPAVVGRFITVIFSNIISEGIVILFSISLSICDPCIDYTVIKAYLSILLHEE